MEARSQVVLLDERPTVLEPPNDIRAFRQICHLIPTFRMGLDGKDLAVDSKATDVVVGTKLKSTEQGVGIRHTEAVQFRQGLRPFHLANRGRGRGGELDGLISKHAAKTESKHHFPQFIAVRLNCSTVAIETQTK